jgi:hypothetical protein
MNLIMFCNIGFSWIPALSGTICIGGVLSLLIAWNVEGRPKYQPNEGNIVYISDVGAHLKTFFISFPITLSFND